MLTLAALALTSALAQVEPIFIDGTLCHPRNLFVRVREDSDVSSLAASGARIIKYLPQIHWAIVEAPVGKLVSTKAKLVGLAGVEDAAYDKASQIAYTPNDPKWVDQWHMRAIKADLAWDISLGTNAAIVAVIDTGVQVSHPDLAANIWVNPGEIAGNGIDDDGNGYVDDVNGYDFVNNDGNPDDDNGHGTACSGIVAGVGDNSVGVSGVAPRARVMAIKCGRNDGYFFDSATVPAYLYATDMGARVFSMSFYSDRVSKPEEDGINYAAAHNVLPVAAAGNDSTVYSYYPGAYEKVLSVAAVDTGLNKAGFSDWGSWVDVAAPGVSLTTTARGSSYTGGFAGTSGACPHVAGLAALLIGANPAASASKVRKAIEDTATSVSQAPFGEYANYGLVNAEAAMKAVTGKAAPSKSSVCRWISPIGTAPVGSTVSGKIYGRSLTSATVNVGGSAATMKSRTRDSAMYQLPTTAGSVEVLAGGSTIATYSPPVSDGFVYPLIEGSTKGASFSGGFVETLNADSQYMKVTRRGDGTIWLEATFRNVPIKGKMTLVFRRSYPAAATGTEYVQLYNWASASYPYGSYDTFSNVALLPTATDEVRIHIPNIAPYVDFDNTVYLKVLVQGASSGNELHLDQAYLQKGYH